MWQPDCQSNNPAQVRQNFHNLHNDSAADDDADNELFTWSTDERSSLVHKTCCMDDFLP